MAEVNGTYCLGQIPMGTYGCGRRGVGPMTGYRAVNAVQWPVAEPHFEGLPPDPARPIACMHIPRTAGGTLLRAMQSIFGAERVLSDVHFLDDLGDMDLSEFAVVEGHRHWDVFEKMFRDAWPRNTVTF